MILAAFLIGAYLVSSISFGMLVAAAFANLQENPNACYMIMEPGNTLPEWKGLRIYLKMNECQTSGDKVDMMRKQIVEKAGAAASKMIHAAVTFTVCDIRPLADMGQGWEKST